MIIGLGKVCIVCGDVFLSYRVKKKWTK